MKSKEAKARIKINKLLEEAGWRFLDDKNGPANIQVEPNIKTTIPNIKLNGIAVCTNSCASNSFLAP